MAEVGGRTYNGGVRQSLFPIRPCAEKVRPDRRAEVGTSCEQSLQPVSFVRNRPADRRLQAAEEWPLSGVAVEPVILDTKRA
jgi:hypothetical protein